PDQQISLTDPDARSTATSGRGSGVVGTGWQYTVLQQSRPAALVRPAYHSCAAALLLINSRIAISDLITPITPRDCAATRRLQQTECSREHRLDALGIKRQVAQTPAGRVREGVGDGSNHRALRAFACAERFFARPVDQLDFNLRHLRHAQD